MAYRITRVEATCFPDIAVLDESLAQFATSVADLRALLSGYTCPVPLSRPGGYQQHLARNLSEFLLAALLARAGTRQANTHYSESIGERADIAVGDRGSGALYVEIEFRPNVEKDLAKFQIGHHKRRLAVGVLILALDRNALNPGYTSMPEYSKFQRVIVEFRPLHPLLLIGIDGRHVTSPSDAT